MSDESTHDQNLRTEATPESWITELRSRLADPPPRTLAAGSPGADGGGNGSGRVPARVGDGAASRRAAALVPLFVEAGNLWTLITERAQRLEGHLSPPAFPGALVEPGEDVWQAARRGARHEAGLDGRAALDAGRLDDVATPAGVVITPCVGAVPAALVKDRGTPAEAAGVTEVVLLPLVALAQPTLLERRPVEAPGGRREITILHVGKRHIWGVTADVVLNLLARLGMSPALDG
jgi:ADP-ribose pyrophosphatase YjhB (NUDIX family)